jgi:hypothetical protein
MAGASGEGWQCTTEQHAIDHSGLGAAWASVNYTLGIDADCLAPHEVRIERL